MDNANKAKKALGGAGLSLTEGTLVEFELTNKPGALAQLAEKLAKKGINIECAYATVHKSAKKAVGVLGTSKSGETSRGWLPTLLWGHR